MRYTISLFVPLLLNMVMSQPIHSDSTAKEVRAVIARDTAPYSLDIRAENVEDPQPAIRDLPGESLRKRQSFAEKIADIIDYFGVKGGALSNILTR